MYKLIKTGSKILASLALMALVMINFQVGIDGDVNSSALNSLGLTAVVNTSQVNAGNCEPGGEPCSRYEFPDGTVYWEVGEPIVVTPEKKLEE